MAPFRPINSAQIPAQTMLQPIPIPSGMRKTAALLRQRLQQAQQGQNPVPVFEHHSRLGPQFDPDALRQTQERNNNAALVAMLNASQAGAGAGAPSQGTAEEKFEQFQEHNHGPLKDRSRERTPLPRADSDFGTSDEDSEEVTTPRQPTVHQAGAGAGAGAAQTDALGEEDDVSSSFEEEPASPQQLTAEEAKLLKDYNAKLATTREEARQRQRAESNKEPRHLKNFTFNPAHINKSLFGNQCASVDEVRQECYHMDLQEQFKLTHEILAKTK